MSGCGTPAWLRKNPPDSRWALAAEPGKINNIHKLEVTIIIVNQIFSLLSIVYKTNQA